MNILVFRTNLGNPFMVHDAAKHLSPLNGIQRWNVDLDDCDNVLRIEAEQGLTAQTIEQLLQGAGFECEELA